jgi:phosphate transport system protein
VPEIAAEFASRLDRLRADLAAQGERVKAVVDKAFESFFARSIAQADEVNADDDAIDRADVELEKSAVALLTDATRRTSHLEPEQLRGVLTVVKINNELERIADLAVAISQIVPGFSTSSEPVPPTFRVMTNSVVGIVRDTVRAVDRSDASLAKLVLQSENAIGAFKDAIVRDAEQRIASGKMSLDCAFVLHGVAGLCERIADHCTNIAEQIIYLVTGAIVRHMETGWVEVKSS